MPNQTDDDYWAKLEKTLDEAGVRKGDPAEWAREDQKAAQAKEDSEKAKGLLGKEAAAAKEGAKEPASGSNLRKAEENPSKLESFVNNFTGYKRTSNTTNVFALLKRKGGIAAVIALFIGGGLGVGGVLVAPSALVLHLKSVLGDVLNDADPALSTRALRSFAEKFNATRYGFTESSDGKCNIRCRFGTVNETLIRNLEAKGFKVQTWSSKIPGRYALLSLTFPGDTESVKTKAEFEAKMKAPTNFANFRQATKGGIGYFLNGRFGSWLKIKLGVDKLSKFAGKKKTDIQESIRKAMGLSPEIPTDEERAAQKKNFLDTHPRFAKVKTAIDKVSARVASKADVVSYMCLAFDSSRTLSFAIKHAKVLEFAAFAMIFLGLADQIFAGDAPQPEAVSMAMNQITQVDNNPTNPDGTPNPFYGTSGLDNPMIKQDLYPGTTVTSLTDAEKKYTTLPNSGVGQMLALAGGLLGAGVAGIVAARALCKTAAVAGLAVSCGPELIAGLTGLAAAGVGVLATEGAAVLECAVKTVAIIAGGAVALGLALSLASNQLKNDESVGLDETTIGSPVGGALHSGTSQVMGAYAQGSGLFAGSKEQVQNYTSDTAATRTLITDSNRYIASSTPFDISNQYSFIGTFVQSIGFDRLVNSDLATSTQSILSIVPRAFASIGSGVINADAQRRAAMAVDPCPDVTLEAMGFACDAGGNPIYVQSEGALGADTPDVLDYMLSNKQIDEDGHPLIDSEFQKALDFCVNRVNPVGESEAGIEDDLFEYKSGLSCSEVSRTYDYYRAYTMDVYNQDIWDADKDSPTGQTTLPTEPLLKEPDTVFDDLVNLGTCTVETVLNGDCDPDTEDAETSKSMDDTSAVINTTPSTLAACFTDCTPARSSSSLVSSSFVPTPINLERFTLWV